MDYPQGFEAFDIESEYDKLYFPRIGQGRKIRPGITREEAQQFFNCKNAVELAQKTFYSDGWSVKRCIDDVIKGGYSNPVFKNFGVIELHGDTGIRVFKSTVECDYIHVLLRLPVKSR